MTENHPPRDAQEALGGLGIVKALALSEVPGFGLKIAPLLKKKLYPKLCPSSLHLDHGHRLTAASGRRQTKRPWFYCNTSCLHKSNMILMHKPSGCLPYFKKPIVTGDTLFQGQRLAQPKNTFNTDKNIQGLRQTKTVQSSQKSTTHF